MRKRDLATGALKGAAVGIGISVAVGPFIGLGPLTLELRGPGPPGLAGTMLNNTLWFAAGALPLCTARGIIKALRPATGVPPDPAEPAEPSTTT